MLWRSKFDVEPKQLPKGYRTKTTSNKKILLQKPPEEKFVFVGNSKRIVSWYLFDHHFRYINKKQLRKLERHNFKRTKEQKMSKLQSSNNLKGNTEYKDVHQPNNNNVPAILKGQGSTDNLKRTQSDLSKKEASPITQLLKQSFSSMSDLITSVTTEKSEAKTINSPASQGIYYSKHLLRSEAKFCSSKFPIKFDRVILIWTVSHPQSKIHTVQGSGYQTFQKQLWVVFFFRHFRFWSIPSFTTTFSI